MRVGPRASPMLSLGHVTRIVRVRRQDRESNVPHKLSSGGPEASIHLKEECILHSSAYRDALRACAPLSQRRAAVVRSRCEYRSSDGRSVNSRKYNNFFFFFC